MEKRKCDFMICVSTRQNTTNLVPFLQLNGKKMIILETNHSCKQKWGENFKKVLLDHDKDACLHGLGEGDNLEEMINVIHDCVVDVPEVCWNIGGGQKMQQTALLSVFRQRVQKGCDDWACYADPGARKLFVITDEEDQRKSEAQTITTHIQLSDILTIFGLRIKEKSNKKHLWSAQKDNVFPDNDTFQNVACNDFMDNGKRQELFGWFMKKLDLEAVADADKAHKIPGKLYGYIKQTKKLDKKVSKFVKKFRDAHPKDTGNMLVSKLPKELFETILPEILKEESEKHEHEKPAELKGLKNNFPDYFEIIVQKKIQNILTKATCEHHVCEAWANVRVEEIKTGKEIAEWDVVLVTSFGAMIILDAKTGVFPQKDEDARLYNLEKASGFYGDFQVVLPFFWEDVKEDGFFDSKDGKWQKQRRIPLNLHGRGSRFMAVMDMDDCYVWQEKGKHLALSRKKPDSGKEAVKVVNVDLFLENLRLKR